MIPFAVEFARGQPVYQQVVESVQRAILSGQLKTGDAFPALHQLVRELRIHPASARRAVAQLAKEGWLTGPAEDRFVVTPLDPQRVAQRLKLLKRVIEPVVREARRLGVNREDLLKLITENWSVE